MTHHLETIFVVGDWVGTGETELLLGDNSDHLHILGVIGRLDINQFFVSIVVVLVIKIVFAFMTIGQILTHLLATIITVRV